MPYPADCRYRSSHEWARKEADLVAVGITQFAADTLTDITFVDLPKVGLVAKAGDSFGEVESVKATSSLYAPVAGTVVEVNAALKGDPGLINREPQGGGWMIKLKPSDPKEMDALLDAKTYESTCLN